MFWPARHPSSTGPGTLIDSLNLAATYISIFSAGHIFLQAIGHLMSRPLTSSRVVGALVFLWMSLIMLNLGLGRDVILEHLPYIYALHVPFYFMAGPLTRAYFLGVVSGEISGQQDVADAADGEDGSSDSPASLQNVQLRFPGSAMLVPFVLATLIYLPFFVLPGDLKIHVLDHYAGDFYLTVYRKLLDWVVYIGLASAAFYFGRTFLQIGAARLITGTIRIPAVWHLRVMLIWLVILLTLSIPVQYLDSVVLKRFIVASVGLAVLWMYLLDYRYPRFIHRLHQQVRVSRAAYVTTKYSKSRIESLDVTRTIAALEIAMTEDRLYADEDLSFERLATATGILPAQVSELLNNVMKVDFHAYVNGYRVRAAQSILADEPRRSIASVARAVGFNSRTSFHRNFKKITGLSPQQYRSQLRSDAVT